MQMVRFDQTKMLEYLHPGNPMWESPGVHHYINRLVFSLPSYASKTGALDWKFIEVSLVAKPTR